MLPSLRTVDDDLADALNLIDDLEFEAALPILARVVAFAPDRAMPYQLWAFCHVQLGRFERAIEIVDEGLARGILPEALLLHKSEALRRLQRFDEAAAAADAVIELDPDSGNAIRARAAVEMARGQEDRALTLLRNALQNNPDDLATYDLLLALANELERHALVIEYARGYLRRFEKDAGVLSMLGHAYHAMHDYRRADRAFRDAAHLEPEEVTHHANVLVIALLTRNTAAFDAYLERLAERDPEMAELAAREVEVLLSRVAGKGENGGE